MAKERRCQLAWEMATNVKERKAVLEFTLTDHGRSRSPVAATANTLDIRSLIYVPPAPLADIREAGRHSNES